MPQYAESILNDLIQQINCLKNNRKRDDLAVRRLKKQVQSLQKNQPERAYMILGMLAVIEHRASEMHAHFQRARQLAPNDSLIVKNYINALANMGMFSAALEVTKILLQNHSGDLEALELAIKNACSACRLHDASEYLQKWQSLSQQNHSYAATVENGIWLYKQTGLSDKQAEAMQIAAFELLETENICFVRSKMLQIKQQTIEFIIYDIFIQANQQQVQQLNRQLAQVCGNSPELNHLALYFAYQTESNTCITFEAEILEGICYIRSFQDKTVYFKPIDQQAEIICCYPKALQNSIYQLLMRPVQVQALVRRDIDHDKIISIHIYELRSTQQVSRLASQSVGWHWQPARSFEQLAVAQGVNPVMTTTRLLGGWPLEDVNDEFEMQIRQWRCEEKL